MNDRLTPIHKETFVKVEMDGHDPSSFAIIGWATPEEISPLVSQYVHGMIEHPKGGDQYMVGVRLETDHTGSIAIFNGTAMLVSGSYRHAWMEDREVKDA